MAKRGQKRKIWKSPDEMLTDWQEYKKTCAAHTITKTQFSQREGRFVSEEVPAQISCTQLGFALWKGMSERTLYAIYGQDPDYAEVMELIAADCEADSRRLLETGTIPTALAGLWMGRYGYTTRTEQRVEVARDDTLDAMDDFFKRKKAEAEM